jgi:antimicrobial peptide system SdpB family protein
MIEKINTKIRELTINQFPFTNTIGLARSIIALGTLLTLMINPLSVLLHKTTDGKLINPFLSTTFPLYKYNFFLFLGIDNIIYMKWLAVVILMITMSGYFIKITSVLHWWISISFLYFSSIIDGGDQIAANLSLLLLPFCLTDPRKNHWSTLKPFESPKNIIGIISIWIIRLQVAIIYYHAALGKISVTEWSNGTAIYYWFNHSVFGMPIGISSFINRFLSNYLVVSILTYSVILLEIVLFLGLTASVKTRKRILYFGILFHFSIIVFHGIFSFFFSILGGLILYLYPTYQPLNFKLCSLKK